MTRRKIPEDYHTLAKKRSFQWLGPEVLRADIKTWWECQQNHRWEAIYGNIQQGRGCPVCANENRGAHRRKQITDYQNLAGKRGFKWLGPEVLKTSIKTWWKCLNDHEWEATYSNIKRGSGCPICAAQSMSERKRHKPTDYHILAENRSFKWLGPEVFSNRDKTWWECSKGHKWETTYTNFQKARGCIYCTGHTRVKIENYYALAEARGFKWLGPMISNSHIKTWWECKHGHKWESRYSSIRIGHGCPICVKERAAIQYRHKPIAYYSLAAKCGFKWLGPKVLNANAKTRWECRNGHCFEARYGSIQQGRGCPYCSGKARKTSADYHALAEARGFTWRGQELPQNSHTKTWWQCSGGHKWKISYHGLWGGSGCPYCADMVNGYRVSNSQRQLCDMVNGKLNHPFGRKRIDVALPDKMIAIEYDSWYWHGFKQDEDAKRDEALLTSGWKILHVKSNGKLPTLNQIEAALDLLRNGESITEIVLDDWGEGPTFKDIHSRVSTVEQLGLWI